MIESISKASVACGCDGLEIEVHDIPDEALTDKKQTISIEKLESIINEIKKL